MVKQFCCVCTRPRGAGHPPPFGKNCRMPPLSTPERQKNLADQQKIALGQPLSDGDEEFTDEFDSAEELAAQEKQLQQQKELLLKKKEEANKQLEEDKKLKEHCDRVKQLKAEIELINNEVMDKLQKSHSIHLEVQKELPGRPTVPTSQPAGETVPVEPQPQPTGPPPGQPAPENQQVVPGVHNFAGARPKVPTQQQHSHVPRVAPAAAAAALDPGLQVYGQAYAAYAPVHAAPQHVNAAPGPGAAPVPGIGPQAWLQQQPLLGAAAGIAAAPSGTRSSAKFGKCLPEYYIEQSASIDEEAEKARPSYYEFMHAVFTLLVEKHVKDHQSVDDLLLYYEQITNFATSHKWNAVYRLHTRMCKEVSIGLRNWSQEIRFNKTFKVFNAESDLSLKKATSHGAGGAGGASNHKNHGQGARPRAQSERGPPRQGGGWSAGGGAGASDDPDRPICRNFNWTARGCRFGSGTCGYRHECATCEEKGVKASHPAMYCAIIQGGVQVQGDGSGGRNK